MSGDGFTPGKYTAKAHGALHGKKKKGLGLIDVVALTLSFAAGILIVTGLLNLGNEDVGGGEDQLARSVGEPATPFEAEDSSDVGVEVAGVVCEVQQLGEQGSPTDVVALWNLAVVSQGDECSAPFADSLGPSWEMTDTELSVFGPVGSVYEFANTGGVVSGLRISLVPEDVLGNELADLGALIDTVWGAETIDWANGCDVTPSSWSGDVVEDPLRIELTRCR